MHEIDQIAKFQILLYQRNLFSSISVSVFFTHLRPLTINGSCTPVSHAPRSVVVEIEEFDVGSMFSVDLSISSHT